jgi:hypothetical protein
MLCLRSRGRRNVVVECSLLRSLGRDRVGRRRRCCSVVERVTYCVDIYQSELSSKINKQKYSLFSIRQVVTS